MRGSTGSVAHNTNGVQLMGQQPLCSIGESPLRCQKDRN
jgi:hypothetical protein